MNPYKCTTVLGHFFLDIEEAKVENVLVQVRNRLNGL